MTFSAIVIYFAVYSILGWACETVFVSIARRKLVKRGILYGPYCPIYGFAGVLILLLNQFFPNQPFSIFILSLFAASLVEYITSWGLEALFHVRLWDYSHKKINLNGRVCLQNAIIFGFLGLFQYYLLNPLVQNFLNATPHVVQIILSNLFLAIIFIDFMFTLHHMIGLAEQVELLHEEIKKMQELEKQYHWFHAKNLRESVRKLRGLCLLENDKTCQHILIILDQWENAEKHPIFRFFIAYPHVRFTHLLSEKPLNKTFQQWAETEGEKAKFTAREMKKSFKKSLKYYDLFWIFLIASVLGYVVEMIFCVLTRGQIQSRQGMLYGPISQIYGMGAVLMVLLLMPLSVKSNWWVFIGSALLGGGFEVLCSLAQQAVFGTVSWNYGPKDLGLFGGRTSLTFMLFWGILGLIFVKEVYPLLEKIIHKIPRKIGVPLTAILTALILIDALLSVIAVYRWTQRNENLPATNIAAEFLDKHYPNSYMSEIYPNMRTKK